MGISLQEIKQDTPFDECMFVYLSGNRWIELIAKSCSEGSCANEKDENLPEL